MKRPTIKPSQRINSSSKNQSDWKDNRLVVAALSAAGTATLFSTVIMPLVNTVQVNKIQQLEELTKNAQTISDELAKTKEKLAQAKSEISLAIQKSPFIPGSAYPLGGGLDSAVLGTNIKELANRLPEIKKEEDENYFKYSISNHPIFSGAAYYPTDGKVFMILYHLKDRTVGGEMLKKVLLTNFGEPIAEKKGSMLWKIKNDEWAILENYKAAGYSYKIQKSPYHHQWGELLEKKKK